MKETPRFGRGPIGPLRLLELGLSGPRPEPAKHEELGTAVAVMRALAEREAMEYAETMVERLRPYGIPATMLRRAWSLTYSRRRATTLERLQDAWEPEPQEVDS